MDLRFKKRLIDKVAYEAASAFDVNNDGILDIVCGEYWYEGPDFKNKHKICDIEPQGEYFDDFADLPMDVNGDGYIDIITGGWFGKTLRWRENPCGNGEWQTYDIDKISPIESIRFYDIDNCGTPEIFTNTPTGPQAFYKLILDENGKGTGKFEKFVISDCPSGHGLGFADVNGDGKTDIILAKGWLEQPEDLFKGTWEFHNEFDLGRASVPIFGYDVNGDGKIDLIAGEAHGYGLYWMEQKTTADGGREWEKHMIDDAGAQYHDMMLVDIDGDGLLELLAGKRYRAHCGNDPGDNDPVFIYYFKIKNGKFEKHVIDYGEAGEASGLGIYFWVADLNGNEKPDIIAPGKEGLFLFENLGY